MHNRVAILIVLFLAEMAFGQPGDRSLRENMVEKQLKSRGITDKATIKAMLEVPRHEFVPKDLKHLAYDDGPLPIGEEQTISQPYIVAYMTQSLNLKSDDNVLEIGTGSGYQAAVLGEIVDSVHTIEIVEKLGLRAIKKLRELGYTNVNVKIGDGYHGWPEKSPFDAIIITAGAETIPPALIAQLADGGRLIIPKGSTASVQQLVLVTKSNGKLKTKTLLPVRFVPFTRDRNH